jgi:hypothetical protein
LKTDCFIGVEETLEALQYKQASSCHQRWFIRSALHIIPAWATIFIILKWCQTNKKSITQFNTTIGNKPSEFSWLIPKSDVSGFSYWRTCRTHSFPYHLGSRKIDHKIEHENFRAYEKIIEVLTLK